MTIPNFSNASFELGSGTVFTDWNVDLSGSSSRRDENAIVVVGHRSVYLATGNTAASQVSIRQDLVNPIPRSRRYLVGILARGARGGEVLRIAIRNVTTGRNWHTNESWVTTTTPDIFATNRAWIFSLTTEFKFYSVDWVTDDSDPSATINDTFRMFFGLRSVSDEAEAMYVDSAFVSQRLLTEEIFADVVGVYTEPNTLDLGSAIVRAHYLFDSPSGNVVMIPRTARQENSLDGLIAYGDLVPKGTTKEIIYRSRTSPNVLVPFGVLLNGDDNYFEALHNDQVGTEIRTNVFNPDFELGTGNAFTGWNISVSGTGTVIEETTLVHNGTRAVEMEIPATGVASILQILESPVRQNERYNLSVWSRSHSGTVTLRIAIRNSTLSTQWVPSGVWKNVSVGASLDPGNAFTFTATTTYQRFGVEFPTNELGATEDDQFRVIFAITASSDRLYVDNAQFTQNFSVLGVAKHNESLVGLGSTLPILTKRTNSGPGYAVNYIPASNTVRSLVEDIAGVQRTALSPANSWVPNKWQPFALKVDWTAGTAGELKAGCGQGGLGTATAFPTGKQLDSIYSRAPFRVGANAPPSNFLSGGIAEVIVVKGIVSDEEINRYLAGVS